MNFRAGAALGVCLSSLPFTDGKQACHGNAPATHRLTGKRRDSRPGATSPKVGCFQLLYHIKRGQAGSAFELQKPR